MGVINNIPDLPYNVSTPEGYFDWLAVAMPIFWPIMLSILTIIIWARSINVGASRAFIGATLITAIVGSIVAVLGWMDPNWMYLFGISFALSLIWRHLESGE